MKECPPWLIDVKKPTLPPSQPKMRYDHRAYPNMLHCMNSFVYLAVKASMMVLLSIALSRFMRRLATPPHRLVWSWLSVP
jgi:hypothetical protein